MKTARKPRAFAANTKVAPENTVAEIRKLLRAHGAQSFNQGEDERSRKAHLLFVLKDKAIRFTIDLPDPKDRKYQARTRELSVKAHEQEVRRRYRLLLLLIKGKLLAIAEGAETIEVAFLAYIVLHKVSGNPTLAEYFGPGLESNTVTSTMNTALLLPPSSSASASG